jgi:hypothetical protein
MSVVNSKYGRHQQALSEIVEYLKEECQFQSVYSPVANFSSPKKFDPPEIAAQENLPAIKESRRFILIYSQNAGKKPSSITFEAGYALRCGIESFYFVHQDVELPYMMQRLHNAYPDLVKMYSYRTLDEIKIYLQKLFPGGVDPSKKRSVSKVTEVLERKTAAGQI